MLISKQTSLPSALRLALALTLALAQLPLPAHAAPSAAARLALAPGSLHPGGLLHIEGESFSPTAVFGLSGHCLGAGISALSDGNGRFTVETEIRAAAESGLCEIRARDQASQVLASASLQVLPAQTLSLEPASGPPGAVVTYTLHNLEPGSLRLDYAGVPLLGPIPLPGDSSLGSSSTLDYTGVFTVPADRPDPLGPLTQVQALNLVGGRAVGASQAAFQTQAAPQPPQYAITSVGVPTYTLAPGAVFTVTGRVSPAPGNLTQAGQAAASSMQIFPMWQTNEGSLLPVGDSPSQMDAQGNFSIRMHVPDLTRGDADTSNGGFLVLAPVWSMGEPYEVQGLQSPLSVTVAIRAYDITTTAPIPGAVVEIASASDFYYQELFSLAKTRYSHQDQLALWAIKHHVPGFGDLEQAPGCVGSTFDWTPEKIIPESGEAQMSFNFDLTHLNPWNEEYFEQTYQFESQPVEQPASLASEQDAAGEAGYWERLMIIVDAVAVGYGEFYQGYPRPALKPVDYNPVTHKWRDVDKGQTALLPPFEFYLPPLPQASMNVVLQNPTTDPDHLYGFHQVQGAEINLAAKQVTARAAVFRSVDSEVHHVTITSPLGETHAANKKTNVCGGMLNEYSYDFFINPADLSPGKAYFLIEAYDAQSNLLSNTMAELTVFDVPAWFNDPGNTQRKADNYTADLIRLTGKPLDGTSDASSSQEQTPSMGAQTNRLNSSVTYTNYLYPDGKIESQTAGENQITILNKSVKKEIEGSQVSPVSPSRRLRLERCLVSAPQGAFAPGNGVYDKIVLDEEQPLFNSGYIPVFTMYIAAPFLIAYVGVGAGFQFDASYSMSGYLQTDPLEVDLTVAPKANLTTDMWLDAGVLGGLIAQMEAKTTVLVGVKVPVHLKNMEAPEISGACFRYWGSLYGRWGLICIPLTDTCLFGSEDTSVFMDGTSPSNCTYQGLAQDPTPLQSAMAEAPHSSQEYWQGREIGPADGQGAAGPTNMQASLSASNRGASLLYQQTERSMALQFYNGANWGEGRVFTTGLGLSNPRIAELGEGLQILAWQESSLAQVPPSGTPITDVIKTYHIVYSLLDGGDLVTHGEITPPTTGDGRVALASCPSDSPGCPAGGEAAAVWVHDRVGSAVSQNYSLYYSIYSGASGAWSAPRPVIPEGSPTFTGSDTLPQVAYSAAAGRFFAAWVRDADRSPDTLDDRRLATRYLGTDPWGGEYPVEVLTSLPARIADFSLVLLEGATPVFAFTTAEDCYLVDNRHPLFTAYLSSSKTRQPDAWVFQKLVDTHGRAIFAEHPVLTVDDENQPSLTFRGLGFAPQTDGFARFYPGDSLGMLTRTGDLVMADLQDLNNPQVGLTYLTNDGAVNWQPAAVSLPLLHKTLAVALRGPAPQLSQQQRQRLAPAFERVHPQVKAVAAGSPFIFADVARQPDFALEAASPTNQYPVPGDPLTVTAELSNRALGWSGSTTQTLNLVAAWDAPYGLGALAGQASLPSLFAGQGYQLDLAVSQPADLELPHTLYLSLNPTQTIPEQTSLNNSLSLQIGGLPVPNTLVATHRADLRSIFLQWEGAQDSRIEGYRVYRSPLSGDFMPVGSSYITGFVDLTASPGIDYRYAVTSYSERGVESALSLPAYSASPIHALFLPTIWK